MSRLIGAVVIAVLCVLSAPAGETAGVLRVCADPDNLPFSSSAASGPRGLYIELAELVAARLGMATEYTWWRTEFGMRSVRNTMLADRCDVTFGLPQGAGFMARSLVMTRPFLDVGYAVIAKNGSASLGGRRVAVVFGSTPQLALSTREGIRTVTFKQPEEALDALARGEVDAAFVWGPTAGYYNLAKLGGRYAVTPVGGEGLQWKVGAAVKKGHEALAAQVDGALGQLEGEIRGLADRYGFPVGPPVALDAVAAAAEPAATARDVVVHPFKGNAEAIAAGRRSFNQHCAHCHGPNAFNPEPSRDLRRLVGRYGDDTAQVFYGAVAAGRPAKGMPTWGGLLDTDTIWRIWAFLETVQQKP